jgi:hypothetical protein
LNVGQVLVGLGMDACGIAFFGGCLWYVRDNGRMSRLAESRWWYDRRVVRKVRLGAMTKDEWFERFIRRQRALVMWGFTPIAVIWFVGFTVLLVRGVRG